MTIRDALRRAIPRLKSAGVPDADHDAGWLMGHVLMLKRLEALARGSEPLSQEQAQRFEALIARRERREPLQYILGEAPFMDLSLLCRPPVLIPREDSEAMVIAALDRLPQGGTALDLCCGSGAIGIAIKHRRPDARLWAGDISPEAIRLTRDNAERHGIAMDIRQGDLFAPFQGLRFDLICCNPPYIPAKDLQSPQAELRYEPRLALDGGPDGLRFYRRIFLDAPRFLAPGGALILEVGDGELSAVSAMAQVDFGPLSLYDDHAGLPRAAAAPWKGTHAFTG